MLPEIPLNRRVAIVVVQHVSAQSPQFIADFFNGLCRWLVKEPESHEPLEGGVIYFAPAGYHLMISREKVFELSVDEPVRFSRPSIDVFFETAAEAFGPKLAAIVLSGANDDGARGALSVREAGGSVLIQDPSQAKYPQMPESARKTVPGAQVMNVAGVLEFMNRWERR